MDLLGLTSLQIVLLTGVVSGFTELVKRAFKKDWLAVAVIIVAGVSGGLAALLIGVNPLIGVLVGLSTSGYITIAQNVGKNAIRKEGKK